MSRADAKDGLLRGCPTCGTKVADAELRLRDFRWANDALPGKVGLMDVDGMLTQNATGRALAIEMKPPGARVSTGARKTYGLLTQLGIECWAVWGPTSELTAQRGRFDRFGNVKHVETMPLEQLATSVGEWWAEGLNE